VLIQFVSPDDEHDVLETCRELKVKINRVNHAVIGHLREIFSFLRSRRQGSCWKAI
jgi:hypothetical protein